MKRDHKPLNLDLDLLKDSFITKNGKIYPWGSVFLLLKGVLEDKRCEEGLEVWSKELLPYGSKEYYAEISSDAKRVLVFKKGNKRAIKRIKSSKFITVTMRIRALVDPSGFVLGETSYSKGLIRALEKAQRGEDPEMYDNSGFTRISPKHAGKKVLLMSPGALLSDLSNIPDWVICEGKALRSRDLHPLAFQKWGKAESFQGSLMDDDPIFFDRI